MTCEDAGDCGGNRTQLYMGDIKIFICACGGSTFRAIRSRLFGPSMGGVCSYPPFKAVVVLAGDSVSSLINLNIISVFFSVQLT